MIKINEEEILFSECILIDGLAETWVTIPYKDDPIRICLAFGESKESGNRKDVAEPVTKVEGKKDHSRITLINWGVPFGGVAGPFNIGTSADNRKINVILDCIHMKTVAKVILQVMLGRKDAKA